MDEVSKSVNHGTNTKINSNIKDKYQTPENQKSNDRHLKQKKSKKGMFKLIVLLVLLMFAVVQDGFQIEKKFKKKKKN